jgi:hypothetical protein
MLKMGCSYYILRFIKDPHVLDKWSSAYFMELTCKLKIQ